MIVCPLCENAQPAGDACDVCGRPFAPDVAVPVPVVPTEGLEATRFEAVPVDVAAIPELEPTAHEDDPFLLTDVGDLAEGLEPTAAAPVDADAALIPDLEPTDMGIPGDAATPLPELVVCRYCRTPAAPGERLCSRCGMRLPVGAPAPGAGSGGPEPTRICGCGAAVRGSVCPSCGARPR